MRTISLRIDNDIKQRWDDLAAAHGLNSSQLMRQAIVEKLEELEDFYVVRERTLTAFKTILDEDVWKRLSLAD
ncbi:type II toxin-antitoxin system RelB family antitoxin [Mesorhizobium xinjiangense]|uniref:type II toxin-antitoxin system RelB family antitoxin n=1 Tax=Mesorhizobium xinjiangense TaxID=2678685 RepID=UPI0012EE771F|nr:DUF6290 family protein [Mesorhizobium xinjiangense]